MQSFCYLRKEWKSTQESGKMVNLWMTAAVPSPPMQHHTEFSDDMTKVGLTSSNEEKQKKQIFSLTVNQRWVTLETSHDQPTPLLW